MVIFKKPVNNFLVSINEIQNSPTKYKHQEPSYKDRHSQYTYKAYSWYKTRVTKKLHNWIKSQNILAAAWKYGLNIQSNI